MDAHLTNAITNGLHAFCLLIYCLAALRARERNQAHFSETVVGFFLLTFMLKVLGVFVHYAPESTFSDEAWLAIAGGVVLLNYLILSALRFPPSFRLGGTVFSIACMAFAIHRHDFLFLAVAVLVVNLAAALYCRGLLRVGFAGVAASNLVWIVARKGTEAVLGHEVPTAWRYDNDLYHLLLIVSTFTIYKAFARGDGLPAAFGTRSGVRPATAEDLPG